MNTRRGLRRQSSSHTPQFALWALVLVILLGGAAPQVYGCGGFFCQQVPIDQAGEQIIFRQDGASVTAVVLIQYEGAAEDFSWVVPVPGIPQLSTGSDMVFGPLELATRPQFNLTVTGETCLRDDGFLSPTASNDSSGAEGGGGSDVEVLQSLAVGPFDVQIVSSTDADALADWLAENNYDLSDRGRELIAPYVDEGMNFVAVRLLQDRGVGDIQPLIMEYESDRPMIPIRLTAVASLPDMGVIVWLLGSARAVPLNYLHVTPNYTTLNWYAGSNNAYASYQGLITAAMDEAGGQGFATDYAGRNLDVINQLPSVDLLGNELARLSALEDDASFFAQLAGGFVFPQDKISEILERSLPLPAGEQGFLYQVPELLTQAFSAEELAAARTAVVVEINDTIIQPLTDTLDVLDDDLYLTRLYTTLSAEEMTLDPTFSFNPDLEDQALARNATMHLECNRWTLTLGEGTGRDGELVIDGQGAPPGFTPPVIVQDAVFRTETVTTSGPPTVVVQKQFTTAQVNDGTVPSGGLLAICGAGTAGMLIFSMVTLNLMRRRRR